MAFINKMLPLFVLVIIAQLISSDALSLGGISVGGGCGQPCGVSPCQSSCGPQIPSLSSIDTDDLMQKLMDKLMAKMALVGPKVTALAALKSWKHGLKSGLKPLLHKPLIIPQISMVSPCVQPCPQPWIQPCAQPCLPPSPPSSITPCPPTVLIAGPVAPVVTSPGTSAVEAVDGGNSLPSVLVAPPTPGVPSIAKA